MRLTGKGDSRRPARAGGGTFRVHFARATVVYDPRLPAPFMVYPARGKPFAPAFRARDPYQNEIAFFHRLVTGRARTAANPVPLADIRASLALVDAERASARTGRRIVIR